MLRLLPRLARALGRRRPRARTTAAGDSFRAEQQAVLLNAAHAVTSELEFESVLQRLVDEVLALLEADAADCWIFEPGGRSLRCRAVKGVPASNVGRQIPAAGTIGQAIETGRPVLTHDFARSENPPPSKPYSVFEDVMVAPITWRGEARGALGVCARRPGSFAEHDVETLEVFARFASIALHNAESFQERARQARIERGFFRVADALGSPLSLGETLDALAQAAAEALGGDAAVVFEPKDERLAVAASHELGSGLSTGAGGLSASALPFSVDPGDVRIVTSSSLAHDERFDEEWRRALVAEGYRALLSAPVVSGKRQAHAVVVLFVEERTFTDDDIALARHLADAARGALERSDLFEAERRANTLSQRLAALGARLVTNLDPGVVLAEIAGEAPILLDADAATVRLLEGDELVVRATTGARTGLAEGTRSSSGSGFLGEVAQSRAPAVVEDVRTTPRASRTDPLLGEGMSACVAVPMVTHGGGLLGVVTVYSASPRTWRDDEVQALTALSVVASAALANAELYQRVAEEKERNDAILANIADGIVAVDRDERIVLWNATAEQITGVPVEEALGRRVPDVLQRELSSADEAPGEREITILRAGKEVFLSLTEAVMSDSAGAVAGRVFAFRDVSAERRLEQMKSDFVSTVSHELRTPLTSIYGFAETLLRSDIAFGETERDTFLRYIASESERLIAIVDDLLNVARLEAGTIGMAMGATDIAEVVDEAVANASEAANGGHSFHVDLPADVPRAEADREKLTQVLTHLLENAVKFSPDGGTITVSGRGKAGSVEVRVSDEGIGIPRSDQNRIFSKFFRVDAEPLSGVPGTGLGLFLARGLLAAMNGRIWVESKEGQGATFAFELPAWRSSARELVPAETAGR